MLYLGIRPPKAAFFSFRMQPMNDPLLPSSGHSKNIFILIVFVFLPVAEIFHLSMPHFP